MTGSLMHRALMLRRAVTSSTTIKKTCLLKARSGCRMALDGRFAGCDDATFLRAVRSHVKCQRLLLAVAGNRAVRFEAIGALQAARPGGWPWSEAWHKGRGSSRSNARARLGSRKSVFKTAGWPRWRADVRSAKRTGRGDQVNDVARFSDLVGRIYDCALDPGFWPVVLPDIAAFMSSTAAVVNIVGPASGRNPIRSLYHCGFPGQSSLLYEERYNRSDPMVRAGALYEQGETFTAREAVGADAWTRTPVYIEWNLRFGLTEHLCGIIRKDLERIGAISVLRREEFESDEKERLRLLLPHLRRSVNIAQILGDRTVEASRFKDVVDRLTVAVFMIDGTGFVHYANEAGEKLVAAGNVLSRRRGRLVCAKPNEQAALLAAVQARTEPLIAITAKDDQRFVASILPLDGGFRLHVSHAKSATAAIFIGQPVGVDQVWGDSLRQALGLTGAETQLLLKLLDGATISDASEAFGVSVATTKTHLQRLFAKTGTSRQAELIRKTSALLPPVA